MKNAFFVLFLTILSGAIAASQQTKILTLKSSIETALEKNTTVIKAQNNVDAAQGRVLSAYGNYLPTLSATGGWSRSQNDIAANPFIISSRFSTNLSLNYVIFDGLNRESGFNSAKAGAQSSEDLFIRARQTITNAVENSYLNVLRLGQLVKVSEENLKRGNRQLERITESNKVGAVALADVYRQQSQVASDELNLITAQNNFDKAKADLVSLVGLDMSSEYQLLDPSISITIDQGEIDSTQKRYSNTNELSKRALSARPDFLAAKEDFSSTESGVTQARSGYLPTVSASLSRSFFDNEFSSVTNNKTTDWGISVRWNLFDAFRTNQSLQTAIASRKTAEASLAQTERDITVQVKKASLDLDAARKQVEVSQKGLTSATEDRRIADERYNLGAGTLLDLLIANANLVNAQANNINATYNYVIAKRNLEYVLGERTY